MTQTMKLVTSDPKRDLSTRNTVTMAENEKLTLEIRKTEQGLHLDSKAQPLTLTITMTPDGPRVELSHADLCIASLGDVSIEGEHVQLKGRAGCKLETDGELKVRSEKEMSLESTEDCVMKARGIHLN